MYNQEVKPTIASSKNSQSTESTYTRSDIDDLISRKMCHSDAEYSNIFAKFCDIFSYQTAAWNAILKTGQGIPRGSIGWLWLEKKCIISEEEYRTAVINTVATQIQKQVMKPKSIGAIFPLRDRNENDSSMTENTLTQVFLEIKEQFYKKQSHFFDKETIHTYTEFAGKELSDNIQELFNTHEEQTNPTFDGWI